MSKFRIPDPDQQYGEYINLYKDMHRAPGKSAFPGQMLRRHIKPIGTLIKQHNVRSIIDYGCGRAESYEKYELKEKWGVSDVQLYDPAVPEYAAMPTTADALITVDVLEHIPEGNIPWVVSELFRLSRSFVYAAVSSKLASTLLPDGRNAHVTIRDLDWWADHFRRENIEDIAWVLTNVDHKSGGGRVIRWPD